MESLWIDKYRPENFDQLSFNANLNDKLFNLSNSSKIPHMIIYGPDGSGKRTRINCLLSKLFGKGSLKTNVDTFTTKHNSHTIEIPIRTSKYHIEVSPSDAEFNDKVILSSLIKETASNQILCTNGRNNYMVFILFDAEQMTYAA